MCHSPQLLRARPPSRRALPRNRAALERELVAAIAALLTDRAETRRGTIWVDGPADRLLPSRERLQALRLFANQATAALESSAQYETMRTLATR